MRKLDVKTVKESIDLVKVDISHTRMIKFPEPNFIEVIRKAKEIETAKKKNDLDDLSLIVEKYIQEEHGTEPTVFSTIIKDTGEKAYQRAIFPERTQLGSIGEIAWNDLELPIVFNRNSRRLSVDLIGKLNNNQSVLCELKFGTKTNHSNTPIYAVIEVLLYYYLIRANHKELNDKKVFHKNGIPFDWSDLNQNSILIVAANEEYWQHWKGDYEKEKIDIKSWLNSLIPKTTFFSFDNIDFKEQKESKGIDGKYTSSVSGKTEWTEVYL